MDRLRVMIGNKFTTQKEAVNNLQLVRFRLASNYLYSILVRSVNKLLVHKADMNKLEILLDSRHISEAPREEFHHHQLQSQHQLPGV